MTSAVRSSKRCSPSAEAVRLEFSETGPIFVRGTAGAGIARLPSTAHSSLTFSLDTPPLHASFSKSGNFKIQMEFAIHHVIWWCHGVGLARRWVGHDLERRVVDHWSQSLPKDMALWPSYPERGTSCGSRRSPRGVTWAGLVGTLEHVLCEKLRNLPAKATRRLHPHAAPKVAPLSTRITEICTEATSGRTSEQEEKEK